MPRMISCACPRAYVGIKTVPPRSSVVSFMTSIMVLIDSENGCGFWSASVASMMRRSISLTSGSLADGMEKWSSMQMSPVWKTVASPAENRTLAAPRMWPLSHQQGQRPAVVQVGVRYHGRVESIETAEVRRHGAASVGFDPRVDQDSRLAEVQQVAAAAHLAGSSQSTEG